MNPKKPRNNCLNCGKEVKRVKTIYCSSKCMAELKSKTAYQNFLNCQDCNREINIRHFKKYILQEQDCKCCICDMSNIWNGKELIFVLDHIDGNPINNKRENLRLICPNCDSQLDTYKAKNKGKGRFLRRQRFIDGKSF